MIKRLLNKDILNNKKTMSIFGGNDKQETLKVKDVLLAIVSLPIIYIILYFVGICYNI